MEAPFRDWSRDDRISPPRMRDRHHATNEQSQSSETNSFTPFNDFVVLGRVPSFRVRRRRHGDHRAWGGGGFQRSGSSVACESHCEPRLTAQKPSNHSIIVIVITILSQLYVTEYAPPPIYLTDGISRRGYALSSSSVASSDRNWILPLQSAPSLLDVALHAGHRDMLNS